MKDQKERSCTANSSALFFQVQQEDRAYFEIHKQNKKYL